MAERAGILAALHLDDQRGREYHRRRGGNVQGWIDVGRRSVADVYTGEALNPRPFSLREKGRKAACLLHRGVGQRPEVVVEPGRFGRIHQQRRKADADPSMKKALRNN